MKFLEGDSLESGFLDRAEKLLSQSSVKEIREATEKVTLAVREGRLKLAWGENQAEAPAVTNFSLVAKEGDTYTPTLVVDASEVRKKNSLIVAADLIRTMGVAQEYLESRYHRRWQQTYHRAFNLQKMWLKDKRLEQVVFDPRFSQEFTLMKSLVGETRAVSDVGFDDLRTVWLLYFSGNEENPIDEKMFISMRESYIPLLHKEALTRWSEEYLKWPSYGRANQLASGLINLNKNPALVEIIRSET